MNPGSNIPVTALICQRADSGITDLDAAHAAGELRDMDQLIRWAQARRAALGAHLADVTAPAVETLDPQQERALRLGHDGTPAVSEFTGCEVAGLIEVGDEVACAWLGEVLDIRHRHPRMWEAVMWCQMPAGLAGQVARQVGVAGLDKEQAWAFDARFAERMTRRGWRRSEKWAAGLIAAIDPAKAEAKRQERLRRRYARFTDQPDQTGISVLDARLDVADAIRLDAAISRIADILTDQCSPVGEPGPAIDTGWKTEEDRQIRRAQALGLLASPARALALLQGAAPGDDPSLPFLGRAPVIIADPDITTRKTTLVIHLSEEMLTTGSGVARCHRTGPLTWRHLQELIAGTRVTVRPVIDLNEVPAADRYEIPTRIRELLRVRQLYDNSPFSNRPVNPLGGDWLDGDHVPPYVKDGPGGQTDPDKIILTSRRWHRFKTLAGCAVRILAPGVQHWRTRLGFDYLTSPDGTHYLGRFTRLPADLEELDVYDLPTDREGLPTGLPDQIRDLIRAELGGEAGARAGTAEASGTQPAAGAGARNRAANPTIWDPDLDDDPEPDPNEWDHGIDEADITAFIHAPLPMAS